MAVEATERKYQEYLSLMKRRAPTEFGSHWNSVTVEEAVARIRELRDDGMIDARRIVDLS